MVFLVIKFSDLLSRLQVQLDNVATSCLLLIPVLWSGFGLSNAYEH